MTIIRPDIGLIYSLLTAKCFDLRCTFINRIQFVFQGRNPILLLSIQFGVSLIEVCKTVTIEISQVQFALVSAAA